MTSPRYWRTTVALLGAFALPAAAQEVARPLIIDMHMHAMGARAFPFIGEPPYTMCLGGYWPRMSALFPSLGNCEGALLAPAADSGVLAASLSAMRAFNIVGVASGSRALVRQWAAAAPERIIPALMSSGAQSSDSIRQWVADGSLHVLGEMTFQYSGRPASDTVVERWAALAEELDVPLGIHVGMGSAGAAYSQSPTYRMALSDPLQYEDLLIRHPRLRIYFMHAGWPMLDAMIGMLYAHPQLYVDISGINWFIPRVEFHAYLKRLVDAGFIGRIMYGSDQMVWPEAIGRSIEAVTSAPFLSERDKRAILCENAYRFLRLERRSRFPRC